jgi:peptidoglycan/xylan/chitin deacetylase (PgdA/CDA1 family)
MSYDEAYRADAGLGGKLRRRAARLLHRRPLARAPEQPTLSISFDDAPQTAAVTGARLLEARGLRGTYYVSAGLAGTDIPMGRCAAPEDYRRLAEAGHEIACHTYSHLDCGQASGAAAEAEAARNASVLAEWGGYGIDSFAYPYGDVGLGPKAILSKRFATLRGLHHGLIEKGVDLNQAPAVGIEGEKGEAVARTWLARAKARTAWLILYTHDVRPAPSPWGCTPEALAGILDDALAEGFRILTVRDAAKALT